MPETVASQTSNCGRASKCKASNRLHTDEALFVNHNFSALNLFSMDFYILPTLFQVGLGLSGV